MSDSNEFSVEVQQEGGCWQPASVFNYLEKESVACVYLRESPGKDISLSLDKVRWPRDTKHAKQTVFIEKTEVEYCEKHDNFMNNGIYTWVTGEVLEVNNENCLVNTSRKQTRLPKNRLFPHDPKINFKDENVKIYSSFIELVGELKCMSLTTENIKSICKEVRALTVRYIEREDKLHALSIDSHTPDLCNDYQEKHGKLAVEKENSSTEAKLNSEAKLHTHILKVDHKLIGLALGNRYCNVDKASSTDGIDSIKFKDGSFVVVGTSIEAVETAVQVLDVVSVIEEVPICNKHKILIVQRDHYEWGLQQVEAFEADSSKTSKVKLVGRRAQVDKAIEFLHKKNMNDRLGGKNFHRNNRSFQTHDFTPYTSHDSEDFSPVSSPPETLPSHDKAPAMKPITINAQNGQLRNVPFTQQPEVLHSVPYRAKPNVRSDSHRAINTDQPSKVLIKQNSAPDGYIHNFSTPQVHSTPPNTKSQPSPKTSGRTKKYTPRSISSIEILPSAQSAGGDVEFNKEPRRYPQGKGSYRTKGNAPKKYFQQCNKFPSESNSPVTSPNEQVFAEPLKDLVICGRVFTNSDTSIDQ